MQSHVYKLHFFIVTLTLIFIFLFELANMYQPVEVNVVQGAIHKVHAFDFTTTPTFIVYRLL